MIPLGKQTLNLKENIMARLIGTSVSFCIRDIVNGKVNAADVGTIVGSTRCQSNEDWAELIDAYCLTYWKGIERKAIALLWALIIQRRIIQPRLWDMTGDPDHSEYHWEDKTDYKRHFMARLGTWVETSQHIL